MAKKKTGRNGFSQEVKAEALQMLRDGYTQQQAADHVGCSTFSIQQWKKAEAKAGKTKVAVKETVNGAGTAEPAVKSVKKGRKGKRRRKKGVAVSAVGTVPSGKTPITFDEFVQGYWKKCEGASDVLRLPPDIMPKAVQYVNDVLRYAYERLVGE
jgi:transposase-like protein